MMCMLAVLFVALGSALAQVERVDVPAGPGALAPNLAVTSRGVVLTWLEPVGAKRDRRHALRSSRLDGKAWTEPVTIREGTRFFANWADFPSLIEAADGTLFAHWLELAAAGTYDYDVVVARSSDGTAWKRLGHLHADATKTEHGFVSFVRSAKSVRGFWLDGRHLKKQHRMALMTRLIGSADETVLDPDVCSCCQTAAVATKNGALVVYRDHAANEVRDISYVRRVESGWTEPKPVHRDGWRIAACPVNGPAAARGPKSIAVAWYSGATRGGQVLVAFSTNAGETFGTPTVIDADRPAGRVGVTYVGDDAVVCWIGRAAGSAAVLLRRVTQDGELGPRIVVAATRGTRSTGFPRLARRGGRLVVAWRDVGGDLAVLRSALVSLGH